MLSRNATRSDAPTATPSAQDAKAHVTRSATTTGRVPISGSVQPGPTQARQGPAQTEGTQVDADLAAELIASRATTQAVETVIAVLAASRDGASINAAAKASGINYRTAQRIVKAAGEYRQRPACGGELTLAS